MIVHPIRINILSLVKSRKRYNMRQYKVSFITAMGKISGLTFKAPNRAMAMLISRRACTQLSVRFNAVVEL